MKKNLLIIYLIFNSTFSILHALAQPAIQWQNTIGGSMGDGLENIEQTSDGGYITCGNSQSNISGDKTENSWGSSDYWVIKLDANGDIEWQNTIGGNNSDEVKTIHQTSDAGYILGGSSLSGISGDKTESNIGDYDYWIIKLSASGDIQWQNTIGGDSYDYLQSLLQTSDGGYVAAGYSYSNASGDKTENSMGFDDYWIVKLSSTGTTQWQNTIGGSSSDEPHSIRATADHGFIVGGYSNSDSSGDKTENSFEGFDYWIVKLDSAGSIQWENTIGGTGFEWLSDVSQTNSGDYIVAGYSDSPMSGDKTEDAIGASDFWIMKLDAAGNILWQNVLGGNYVDDAMSICQTSDNGYIAGGWSSSDSSADKTENNWDSTLATTDYWIVKLDSLGSVQWDNTIGGLQDDHLAVAYQTFDGGYILGGTSESDSTGDKKENSFAGLPDYWVVKLYPDFPTTIHDPGIKEENDITISPNPATNEIRIQHSAFRIESIEIYNTLGEKVYSKVQTSYDNGSAEAINVSALSSGIYFVKVKGDEEMSTTMIVKE